MIAPKPEYKFREEVMVMINEKVKPEENKDKEETEEEKEEKLMKSTLAEADCKDIF